MRQYLPISSLLLGSFFLLFAGGIHSLILPVRGAIEGFSAVSLGLLGTGWALGYVLGCYYTARLVGRVGHVRSFGVMAALAAIVILAQLLLMSPSAWIPLRAVSGFCFAGAAMIVESWLSERADPSTRGRIFGIYTMVNLLASTMGQMVLTLGDARGFAFFVLGAIFYCLALIPTAISSSQSPRPLSSVQIDLSALWKNSPVAVVAVFMVGISNSAFGTLAAVYGDRIGLTIASVAFFASLPVLAGAAAQIPVGILSDRVDRRKVLVGVALVALLADLAFLAFQPEGRMSNLALAAVFGAAIFSMYPVIIAHANDHSGENHIQTSGGLLMIYGFGGIIGPLVAGFGMSGFGAGGLFGTTLAAHVLLIAFAVWRIGKRASLETADKGDFKPAPPGRTTTPETIAMSVEDEDAAASESAFDD